MALLQKEFDYYIANQNELLKDYNGRFLVIIGEKVVGDYDTYEQALYTAQELYGIGNFLLQECTEGDEAYTATFHSRVRFV
jgi:hypothetical protein